MTTTSIMSRSWLSSPCRHECAATRSAWYAGGGIFTPCTTGTAAAKRIRLVGGDGRSIGQFGREVQLDAQRQTGPPERAEVVDVLELRRIVDLFEAPCDQLRLGFGRILDQQVEIAERAQSGIEDTGPRGRAFIGITSPS